MLTLASLLERGVAEPAARIRAHTLGLEEGGHADSGADSVLMMFAYVAETEAAVEQVAVPALARQMSVMTGKQLADPRSFYKQARNDHTGLFGTPIEVAKQLERLGKLGVDHVAFVSRFGGMSKKNALGNLRMLAPGTVPEHSPLRAPFTPETAATSSPSSEKCT